MQLVNNSRFSVAYTVTLSTPNAYNGSILGGGDANIPQPAFSVEGDAGQFGKVSAQGVPSTATVTFTVQNSVLHIQVEYSG
jgi:hypothetical protein